MRRVESRIDLDENLLHEALVNAHSGAAFYVQSTDTEVWIDHPDGLDIIPVVAATRGKKKPKDKWQQHFDHIDTYGLPQLRDLLKEMLAERLPRQA